MTKRKHINLRKQERKELEEMIKTGKQANRVNSRERVLRVNQRPYDVRYPQVCLDASLKNLHTIPWGR